MLLSFETEKNEGRRALYVTGSQKLVYGYCAFQVLVAKHLSQVTLRADCASGRCVFYTDFGHSFE